MLDELDESLYLSFSDPHVDSFDILDQKLWKSLSMLIPVRAMFSTTLTSLSFIIEF